MSGLLIGHENFVPEQIRPPFGLSWGQSQNSVEHAMNQAGAKIVDRAPLLGREAWTIEGIVQPDLKRAIIYFGTARTLVEVELQYESPEWDLIAYEEFLNSARQRLEAKYGPPVVLARDKGPKVT